MTLQQLRIKQHVYYCLLVALKIAASDAGGFSVAQKNTFIAAWLTNAHRKCLFNDEAIIELKWLKTALVDKRQRDPERLLAHIYETSRSWLALHCLTSGTRSTA